MCRNIKDPCVTRGLCINNLVNFKFVSFVNGHTLGHAVKVDRKNVVSKNRKRKS